MHRFLAIALLIGCPRQQPEAYPEEEVELDQVFLRDITQQPAEYIGEEIQFEHEFRVVTVPSEGGFWIEQMGDQMFVLVDDVRFEKERFDVRPGQTIWIEEAEVHDASYLDQIEDEDLDAAAVEVARRLPVYLIVEAEDIRVLNGVRRPGT